MSGHRSDTSGGSCVCGACFSEAKAAVTSEDELAESPEMTEEQLLDSFHLMAPSREDQPILWNAISTYSSMRAREITDLKKWKVRPCTQTFRFSYLREEVCLDDFLKGTEHGAENRDITTPIPDVFLSP